MSRYIHVILILLLVFFTQCTSFNSDEMNRQLIQGKWRLIEVYLDTQDTTEIDLEKLEIYLTFRGDTCIQDLTGMETKYTYAIHNYNLLLYRDSIFENKLEINTLTEDSLALVQNKSRYWIYIKTKQ